MLSLIRCDDRLIHGQCMTVIVKEFNIARIVVVDDMTAGNPVLKTVFQTAVPSSMSAGVYTMAEAVGQIEEAMQNDVRTMLLMKSPAVYQKMLEQIEQLPKELMIGPMSSRKGTVSVNRNTNLLPEESNAIKNLVEAGVHVFFQQVPSEKKIEWDEVKSKF